MLLVELLPKAPEAVVEALPNGPLVRGTGVLYRVAYSSEGPDPGTPLCCYLSV
jgi:hypothetical protein